MLIFLHYYRKMKYFLFYNCLKVSNNPACFGEGFTRSAGYKRNSLFKWLGRRGKRGGLNFEKFELLLQRFPLLTPRILVNLW
jgi:hypothetical protein